MRTNPIVRNAIACYKKNELILASKLYSDALSNEISEAAYYKMLERMCKNNELTKVAKGVYCIPNISKYGVVLPSENEIVSAFTKNNTGVTVGYAMYNELRLTTQIPKNVVIFSSSLENMSRKIRNVQIKQVRLHYSEKVKNMINCLEVLQNFYNIQDLNHHYFIKFIEEFVSNYDTETFQTVYAELAYKKSTIAFLREVLSFYNIPNNLDRYLSSLSTYKHPRMEELYETAQAS